MRSASRDAARLVARSGDILQLMSSASSRLGDAAMRSCAAVILTATMVLLGAARADAGPAEDETFAAFEWFCLAHLNKATKIPGLFKAIRVKPIPDHLSQPFLSGHSGTAWFLPGNHTRLVVTLTDKGACGVANPDVRGLGLKGLFERLLRNLHLSTERIGSETTTAYAVSYPDQGGRARYQGRCPDDNFRSGEHQRGKLMRGARRIMLLEGTKFQIGRERCGWLG